MRCCFGAAKIQLRSARSVPTGTPAKRAISGIRARISLVATISSRLAGSVCSTRALWFAQSWK